MRGRAFSKWQQRKAGRKQRLDRRPLAADLRAVAAAVKDFLHDKKLMRKGERY